MDYKEDRGTLLQITFDVLYPNGQLKSVTMSLADTSEFKNVGMIVFDESLLEKFVLSTLQSDQKKKLLQSWNSRDVMLESEGGGEAPFKPALVLVGKDGSVTTKCGGHGSSGHIGGGTSVHRYMG
jgi:hypothetical protein